MTEKQRIGYVAFLQAAVEGNQVTLDDLKATQEILMNSPLPQAHTVNVITANMDNIAHFQKLIANAKRGLVMLNSSEAQSTEWSDVLSEMNKSDI